MGAVEQDFGLYRGVDRETALRTAVWELAVLSSLDGFDMPRQFFDPVFHAEAHDVLQRWTGIPIDERAQAVIDEEVAAVREHYSQVQK